LVSERLSTLIANGASRGELRRAGSKRGIYYSSTRWCKQGSTRYYLTRRGIKSCKIGRGHI